MKSLIERYNKFNNSFCAQLMLFKTIFGPNLYFDTYFDPETHKIDYSVKFRDSSLKWSFILCSEYEDEPSGGYCATTILHSLINVDEDNVEFVWKTIKEQFRNMDAQMVMIENITSNNDESTVSLSLKLVGKKIL